MSLRMQPRNERFLTSSSLAGSNAVERADTLMEFVAGPRAPKHGPGNTDHYNTVATPTTLNSADPVDVGRAGRPHRYTSTGDHRGSPSRACRRDWARAIYRGCAEWDHRQ